MSNIFWWTFMITNVQKWNKLLFWQSLSMKINTCFMSVQRAEQTVELNWICFYLPLSTYLTTSIWLIVGVGRGGMSGRGGGYVEGAMINDIRAIWSSYKMIAYIMIYQPSKLIYSSVHVDRVYHFIRDHFTRIPLYT